MELEKGKLIQLLGTVEETEHKSLIKFAKSPYHNTNKLIISLLQKLLTYHPDFNHKKLTKEHLYRYIHPEEKAYHEGRMNLLMTNLVDVVQRFFIYQEFEKDAILKRRLKSKAFNNRGFYKKYKKEVQGLLMDLEATPFREEAYFFEKYDIQQEFFFHIETPTGHDGAVYLYNAMDDLDQFYLTAKMKLAAEQITMTKKLNTKIEINLLDPVLEYLEKEDVELSPVIRIYEKFLKLRRGGHNEEDYEELKEMFFGNIEKIELLKQKLIYFNLVNYSVNQYNLGRREFQKELFMLYKFGLGHEYLINNNLLTTSTYSNLASTSANLKEFQWSYNFIHEYEKFLPKTDAYFTKLMALAFWNYSKGKMEDFNFFYRTLELLREIKYSKKNAFLFNRSRNLWIRTCYELLKNDSSYFLILTNYIKNLEIQLKKDNNLSNVLVERNLNFIYYVKNFSMKKDYNKENLAKLIEELNDEKVVLGKNWIIEKVEELQMKLLS